MRRFIVMFRKEMKELVTPQMLLPFIVPVLIFAFIGNIVGQEGSKAQADLVLKVLDMDKSAASAIVLDAAEESGFALELATGDDTDSVLDEMKDGRAVVLVVIPEGFGATIGESASAEITTYTLVRNFSAMGSRDSQMLAGALALASDKLRDQALVSAAPSTNPDFLKTPVKVSQNVIIGDARAPVGPDVIMGFITTQTMFVPIVMFIVIIFAAQMVATAVATEKENKTLESLLAMPVSRTGMVAAKMLAAGLLALAAAAWYMVGMSFYMKGMVQGFGGQQATDSIASAAKIAAELGLTLGITDYALLGLSVFAAILVALAVALIIGAFSENVKAVQALITPLMILVMVPYMLSLFLDISSLPATTRYAILAIPFTHPFVAAPSLFLGDIRPVVIGIVYQLTWFVVLVTIAARIFSSDRILTMKLHIGRKRSGGGER